ncbi:helix-turn-helix domain-containing protein [Streptomyces sp. NPDC004610]|uniref:TetR/AcrR family transcriptional regulator n=1 Tax=unclassified Streptomyces TaxID=2593676 RepID=UPI0033ADBC10
MTTARGRTGRPPLTEDQRKEIRLGIARAAVDLFLSQGVATTTGEQIGRAVGVSGRTVWRYFPSIEACVAPLFSKGIETITGCLRAWPPDEPLEGFLDTWPDDEFGVIGGTDRERVVALLRVMGTEPALRAVWLEAHDEAVPAFAAALAARSGTAAEDPAATVRAAMLNAAMRAAVEGFARREGTVSGGPNEEAAELQATIRAALVVAAQGVR